MNQNQKMKTKFRASKEWKEFRRNLKRKQKIDPLTYNPLTPKCNIHHLDLNENHYTDLSNEEHFLALNKMSHDTIHFLYNIVERRGLDDLMKDLKSILLKMLLINKEGIL